ncbi:MAG: hypothetical protein R2724_14820 [Bryobacterales bacterium]
MAEPVVLQTLADLVSIPSVNSAYPDGVGEAAVVEYLRAFAPSAASSIGRTRCCPAAPTSSRASPDATLQNGSSSRPTPIPSPPGDDDRAV